MTEFKGHGTTQIASPALAPVSGSGADVAEELGVSAEELRSMIKPLVLLMHRKRLPFITIKLNKGIATVSTVKPPAKEEESNRG